MSELDMEETNHLINRGMKQLDIFAQALSQLPDPPITEEEVAMTEAKLKAENDRAREIAHLLAEKHGGEPRSYFFDGRMGVAFSKFDAAAREILSKELPDLVFNKVEPIDYQIADGLARKRIRLRSTPKAPTNIKG